MGRGGIRHTGREGGYMRHMSSWLGNKYHVSSIHIHTTNTRKLIQTWQSIEWVDILQFPVRSHQADGVGSEGRRQ